MSKKTKYQQFAEKHNINLTEYCQGDEVLNNCISSYERTEKARQELKDKSIRAMLQGAVTAADEKITEYLERLHAINSQQGTAEEMKLKAKALSLKMKMQKKRRMNNLSGLSSN